MPITVSFIFIKRTNYDYFNAAFDKINIRTILQKGAHVYLGIDPSALTAVILAGLTTCAPQAPPAITVSFKNTPPQHINTLSHEDLGNFKSDTRISHGRNEIFITGGLTRSNIDTRFEMNLKNSKNSLTRESCTWIDNINVTVTYAPVVYIAKNYAAHSCPYKETLIHEYRHVNTDIITINEYLPHIKAAVATASANLATTSPVDEAEIKNVQDKIKLVLTESLTAIHDKMNTARMLRQQKVDTRQEYLRLGKACAGK